MRKLIRLFRLYAAVRHWRGRALLAEQRLEAEQWRNVERSDMVVSAVVFGSRGMVGIPPRSGPAMRQQAGQHRLLAASDPWDAVTGAEKMEFDMYWKPDAEAAGLTEMQARQRFMRELAERKALNDEPSM